MALAGAQVLDAIKQRMLGLSLTGTRVYTDRAHPLDEKSVLPAWKVVSPDEDIETVTVHPAPVQQHRMQVELQGYVSAISDVDDAMHALAAQALTALFNPPLVPDALSAIAGTKVKLSQRRIERAMSGEGQAKLGLIQITLRAEYRTKQNAPEALA